VLVVERLFLGLGSANEAAVPDANVVDEASGAEKDDLAVLIDGRAVIGLRPRHSLVPI
jgi:hypothetical protein